MDLELRTQLADALSNRDPAVMTALASQVLRSFDALLIEDKQLDAQTRLTLIRLATESPYSELQTLFRQFLLSREMYAEEDLRPSSVSRFVGGASEIDVSFGDAFTSMGRVGHYHRLLAVFPQYFKAHLTLWNHLFDSHEPMVRSWRYYVAFMASATFDCEYLMRLNEDLCLRAGGNPAWFDLRTLGEVPSKLRNLALANLKLAHVPWEFGPDDISELLQSWSVQQLVVALVIMCEIHAVSSAVLGLGVEAEFDLPYKSFEAGNPAEYFADFAGGSLPYINYNMSNFRRPVRPSDFSWNDQGYEILEKLWPGTAEPISVCGTEARYITTLRSEEITNFETEPLRRAIWKYTQRVYGLEYDDYNYQNVNVHLPLEFKRYLKKMICEPASVSEEDFKSVALMPIEMIQTACLVQEALVQTRLLYALHALDAHSKALRSTNRCFKLSELQSIAF